MSDTNSAAHCNVSASTQQIGWSTEMCINTVDEAEDDDNDVGEVEERSKSGWCRPFGIALQSV